MATASMAFDDQVDAWVARAVADGATTFDHLLYALPGVYPPLALNSLRRLTSKALLPAKILLEAEAHTQRESSGISHLSKRAYRVTLPVPHPLDYEWRFDVQAASKLLTESLSLAKPGGPVALVGSPSIFREVIEREIKLPLLILDRNQAVTDYLRQFAGPNVQVELCDVTQDELPDLSASVVVVDPPWYEEYIRAFAWAACRVSRPGANILFGLPPAGTRPGIISEVENFIGWSKRELGLRLVRMERGALPYETPPFEKNAMKAEGISNIPRNWRRGDLAVFVRDEVVITPRPNIDKVKTFDEGDWEEVTVSGMRVRIKKSDNRDYSLPTLVSIVEGDVLPTVSRRDERRRLADVWTAGNRVFACSGTSSLLRLLRAVAAGRSPEAEMIDYLGRGLATKEAAIVSDTVRRILDLARTEIIEYAHAAGDA